MDSDDLNIENRLAYSEKVHGLATGHLQETKQLLDTIGLLQDDNRQLLATVRQLREESAQKDAIIKEREQRIADLQQNSTYNVSGNYIEQQNIGQMYTHPSVLPKRRNAKTKSIHHTQTQLPLWSGIST